MVFNVHATLKQKEPMKSPFLVSLLLVNFYLDAASNTKQQAVAKKQRASRRMLPKQIAPVQRPVTLTAANFKTTLAKDLTIVLVGSDWCKWCGLMSPVFAESGAELYDKATYALLSLGSYFGDPASLLQQVQNEHKIEPINKIPSFLVFKKGKLVEQVEGSKTKEQLAELIKKHSEVTPPTKTPTPSAKK